MIVKPVDAPQGAFWMPYVGRAVPGVEFSEEVVETWIAKASERISL